MEDKTQERLEAAEKRLNFVNLAMERMCNINENLTNLVRSVEARVTSISKVGNGSNIVNRSLVLPKGIQCHCFSTQRICDPRRKS